ncbi:transforming growth factor beta regulator 1 [Biomphalaria pfeifferi]|uniref:Transforming growth factor beta regulator 1 n=1 Tax=Biomphalaria pfeifferi TaxID=112525 RepID=A0AAD8B0J4_BIOPF|nr:transforming growth factor beta regulator 1 [Biomphalaria pfeifferi]
MAASSPIKSSISTLSMTPNQQKAATNVSSSALPLQPAGSNTTTSEDVKPSQNLLDDLMKEKFTGVSEGSSNPTAGTSGASTTSLHHGTQDIYAMKLKKLKQVIKDTIFLNGAICDEVMRTDEKLARAKEERRFLLRKLLQFQSANDTILPTLKSEPHTPNARQSKGLLGTLPVDSTMSENAGKHKAVKRKLPGGGASLPQGTASTSLISSNISNSVSTLGISGTSEAKKKNTQSNKESSENLSVRPKKGKGAVKKVIPPLMLDSLGRPIFPMVLGDITLHSIGEIVPDRLSFHSVESIYPVGFCITRVYASLHKLDSKCLYTCKISDNNDGPLFEIAAEDSSDILFKSSNPVDCHSQLINAVNKLRSISIAQSEGQGLAFFGLSHPVIQNLIQSCPGARKCARYKWVKFEINKAETNENVAVGTNDPSVSYEAFKAHLQSLGQTCVSLPVQLEQSTNLRSLLTKGNSSLT